MKKLLPILLIVALGAACGDDDKTVDTSNNTTDTGAMDTGAGSDMTDDMADMGEADTGEADMGTDTGGFVCDAFPAPLVAGTTATDALADAPQRCGAPAYQWSRSAELGDIVEFGATSSFPAALINAAAASADITLPRPAEYDVAVEQVVYKTQDRGQLIDATTLIAYPRDLEETGPTGVLLVLHGTTGFNDDCSPSPTQEQKALAAILATYGYIVVAPDYIGLKGFGDPTGFKHPYLVGEATAIASLDALRALYKVSPEHRGDLCPSTEFAYFGGSQGGHAALWVDRLAPYYSRELTPLGGVATVPPADLVHQVERATREIVSATGNTIAFFGASSDWYGFESDLDQVFIEPYLSQIPTALATTCDGESLDPPMALDELFAQGILDAATNETMADYGTPGCMLVENSLTTTGIARIPSTLPSYGILNVFGESDNLVNTPIERVAYTEQCNAGAPFEYLECAGAGHTEATFWAFGEILTFLEARISKEAFEAPVSCDVTAPVACSGTP